MIAEKSLDNSFRLYYTDVSKIDNGVLNYVYR